MNFTYTPFGQAMFNTPQCGVMNTTSYVWGDFWVGYNANARICYNVACGADHDADYGKRPASCFDKTMGPYCQHGGAECAVNALQACVRKLANDDWTIYAPVAVCFEEQYASIQVPAGANASKTFAENKTLAEVPINSTTKTCVKDTQLDPEDVLACYRDSEFETLAEMAAATVPHVVIPFVRIMQCDGQWQVLELGDGTPPSNILLDAMCKAACPSSSADSACKKLPPSAFEVNV